MNRAARRKMAAIGRRGHVPQDSRELVGEQSAISDQEAMAVVQAVLRGHHPNPVTEDDLTFALHEVCRMRTEGAIAEMVIDGRLLCRVEDGVLKVVWVAETPV